MTTILDSVHDFTSAAEGTVADLLGHAKPVASSAIDAASAVADSVRHAGPAAISAVDSMRHRERSGPPRGLIVLAVVAILALVIAMRRRRAVDPTRP